MKAILGILCLGLALQARALPEDRFLGGSFDGFARAAYHTWSAAASPRFSGGPYDGFSRDALIQYDGGSSPQSTGPRFFGGSFDGFDQARLIQYDGSSPQQLSPRFHGGSFDGYDLARLIQYDGGSSPQAFGPRFHGGAYDGAARDGAGSFVNPLNFDTDADGLVDWWEALYFPTLTALSSGGDFDSDEADDGDEFVADTNPDDETSFFHIVAITNLPLATLYFDSSTNRLYSMHAASNLVDGTWLPVPGMGPRRGVGGADTMEATNIFPCGFYNLTVELP